jgi:hypothetical protein
MADTFQPILQAPDTRNIRPDDSLGRGLSNLGRSIEEGVDTLQRQKAAKAGAAADDLRLQMAIEKHAFAVEDQLNKRKSALETDALEKDIGGAVKQLHALTEASRQDPRRASQFRARQNTIISSFEGRGDLTAAGRTMFNKALVDAGFREESKDPLLEARLEREDKKATYMGSNPEATEEDAENYLDLVAQNEVQGQLLVAAETQGKLKQGDLVTSAEVIGTELLKVADETGRSFAHQASLNVWMGFKTTEEVTADFEVQKAEAKSRLNRIVSDSKTVWTEAEINRANAKIDTQFNQQKALALSYDAVAKQEKWNKLMTVEANGRFIQALMDSGLPGSDIILAANNPSAFIELGDKVMKLFSVGLQNATPEELALLGPAGQVILNGGTLSQFLSALDGAPSSNASVKVALDLINKPTAAGQGVDVDGTEGVEMPAVLPSPVVGDNQGPLPTVVVPKPIVAQYTGLLRLQKAVESGPVNITMLQGVLNPQYRKLYKESPEWVQWSKNFNTNALTRTVQRASTDLEGKSITVNLPTSIGMAARRSGSASLGSMSAGDVRAFGFVEIEGDASTSAELNTFLAQAMQISDAEGKYFKNAYGQVTTILERFGGTLALGNVQDKIIFTDFTAEGLASETVEANPFEGFEDGVYKDGEGNSYTIVGGQLVDG